MRWSYQESRKSEEQYEYHPITMPRACRKSRSVALLLHFRYTPHPNRPGVWLSMGYQYRYVYTENIVWPTLYCCNLNLCWTCVYSQYTAVSIRSRSKRPRLAHLAHLRVLLHRDVRASWMPLPMQVVQETKRRNNDTAAKGGRKQR